MERKLTDQEIVRREKMAKIAESGKDPFGQRFDRTDFAADIKEKYKDEYNQNLINNQFKELRKLNKSDAHSSFADFKYFQAVNYNFQISRTKYQGLVFFKKLLHNFLNLHNYLPFLNLENQFHH